MCSNKAAQYPTIYPAYEAAVTTAFRSTKCTAVEPADYSAFIIPILSANQSAVKATII
jgi:hypothetical protein